MKEHQAKVKQFVNDHRLACSVEARMLDLLSEVGEVSKEVLKSNNYGLTEFKSTHEFAQELGDVYFSLLALANAASVDMDVALRRALEKYESRLKSKGSAGS